MLMTSDAIFHTHETKTIFCYSLAVKRILERSIMLQHKR